MKAASGDPGVLPEPSAPSWADEMEADPTLAGCEIEEAEAWSVVDGDEDDNAWVLLPSAADSMGIFMAPKVIAGHASRVSRGRGHAGTV